VRLKAVIAPTYRVPSRPGELRAVEPVSYALCEVCGAADPRLILRSQRLDGPLVRCRACGLVYVGERQHDFTFDVASPDRTNALGVRVTELGIVDAAVEERERELRLQADRERLERLRRHVPAGRLLDVGSALGTFLEVAEGSFEAEGVEPDPGTSGQARVAGRRVSTGTLAEMRAPPGGFDAITMFHVIEHLDSPRAALEQSRALLRDGGVLLIETPTVANPWFRVAPGRWRQLIPDHYFFFARATLERLLHDTGFEPVAHARVGRRVSLRFATDRLRRAGVPGAGRLTSLLDTTPLGAATVHLNPLDIMEVVARARGR
jgi:SAM-dependent methyltransferase